MRGRGSIQVLGKANRQLKEVNHECGGMGVGPVTVIHNYVADSIKLKKRQRRKINGLIEVYELTLPQQRI